MANIIIDNRAYQHDMDPEDHHERNVYYIVNNNGYNLNRPGNEGYYTRSHHFHTTDDWDSIFDHLLGHPHNIYPTSDFIYDLSISGRAAANPEAFPEIVYIPLPSNEPGFKRCILHVEEVDTGTGTLCGRYIPIVVKYHVNHQIAHAIMRLFDGSRAFYQTKEQLLMLTSYSDVWIHRMCEQFRPPGNNFETFDEMLFPAADHVLPDPEVVIRANREICILPDYDDNPRGAQEARELWRNVVYPRNASAEERREMYATFAAEQVNMHRISRIQWGHDYPNRPNPIELPRIVEQGGDGDGDGVNIQLLDNGNWRENNPADRNAARLNLANVYIQHLWDGQNNEERARVASTEVRLRAVQNEAEGGRRGCGPIPVNHMLNLDG